MTLLDRGKAAKGKRAKGEFDFIPSRLMFQIVPPTHGVPKEAIMKDYDAFCATIEKERLVEEIRQCEFCTDSYEEHHECRRQVSKEAGERLQGCIID
jgi:hypothetical protein